jgi:hypothetical protein
MADKNLLLVEGKDDEHVFYYLLERHQVLGCFRIIITKLICYENYEDAYSGIAREQQIRDRWLGSCQPS